MEALDKDIEERERMVWINDTAVARWFVLRTPRYHDAAADQRRDGFGGPKVETSPGFSVVDWGSDDA
uniref:Uncharacterized protein n=1 Tax=Mycena chlorophos TaxID=658473 RepID=A0ABQ0LZ32_MYCCL|nr:predicted protein [Mycena chlorophos]